MRQRWAVQLLVLLTLVVVVLANSPTTVEQVHIAHGHTPGAITVSWVTSSLISEDDQVSVCVDKECVGYDIQEMNLRYTAQDSYESGYIQHAKISGLLTETSYVYTVPGGEKRSFTTLPDVGVIGQEILNVGVVGDLGQTDYSKATVASFLNRSLDLVLHAGDMSYADCDAQRWDSWFNMVEDLASSVPFMVCTGNHEIEVNTEQKNAFQSYKMRFRMPEIKPTSDTTTVDQLGSDCCPSAWIGEYNYGNSFYSFDTSLLHVIVLNSYSQSDSSSPQYQWLIEDLKGVDRKKTPWVIAMFHDPWYNSNTDHQQEFNTLDMKASLESVFYQYGVNLVAAGHVHAYERSYPVYQEKRDPKGTVYVNVGDGGNREGHSSTWETKPDWNAVRDGEHFGLSMLHLYNHTHILYEWHRNVDDSFEAHDSFWMINNQVSFD